MVARLFKIAPVTREMTSTTSAPKRWACRGPTDGAASVVLIPGDVGCNDDILPDDASGSRYLAAVTPRW